MTKTTDLIKTKTSLKFFVLSLNSTMVSRKINFEWLIVCFISISVNVFQFILVNVVYRLEMLVGNYIVLNMEYNRMDKCQLSVHLDRVMIHFKHFLRKQELENVRYSNWIRLNLFFVWIRCTSNGFYWSWTDSYW